MRALRLNMSSQTTSRMLSGVPSGIKNSALWKPTSCFINGKFTMDDLPNKFAVTNPANGETIAMLPRMTANDTKQCEQISWDAWQKWKRTTAKERSKILAKMAGLMHSNIDDLARIITLECGKPLPEARGEVMYAAGFLEWYAEEAKRMYGDIIPAPVAGPRKYLTTRQAVGPAALITPWNFPSAMITRKIAPAFAAGCTVTIKPAEETPLSALALCVLAQEAGVPDGVMNVVTVTREDVVAVGTQFCHSDYYRKISFTGSTNVGKWLLRESAMSMKRVCLENGGNAPFIIFDDADLDVALRALMAAKFRNAGQACIAANRIYVQDGVYDKFADMLTSKVSTLVCGDGLSAGVTMGPLINEAGVTKVDRQVQDCLAKGAILRCGGSAHTELNAQGGTFYLPTVLTEVTADMQPFLEETFGPVAPLCRFSTEEDVIHQANATRSGLAGYACTSSLSRAWRVAEELEFGLVGINEGAISSEVAPFGGMKDSGLGREGGHQGLEAYLETKYIHMLTE